MKKLIFIFIALIIFSCEDELFIEELSEADHAALEGMEESFLMASAYQDSLVFYTDIEPDHGLAHYHDEMFDLYDDQYEQYHQMYSHLNAFDDHHHVPNPPDHGHYSDHVNLPDLGHEEEEEAGHGHGTDDGHDHGGGDAHEEPGHTEAYEHTLENHLKMLDLREQHEAYHVAHD